MDTIFISAVAFIILLAVLDLWVGVTNDAVNFINSAIGAKIASKKVILITVSFGVVFGALVSSGMMEVARKGIFDPSFFYENGTLNITAILCVYLGVMAADIITLDLFNTLGLPTSTTVSIVSELVGASVAVALWMSGGNIVEGWSIIKSEGLVTIYVGIFLSILVAFTGAAIAMFLLRLVYSHDLEKTFPKSGWLWTGISFSALSYFVLFKGLAKSNLLSDAIKAWLTSHVYTTLGLVFVVAALVAVIFAKNHRLIFKAIILTGTCSLAIAFAGNDLVNFIGPSVAAAQAVFVEGVQLSGKVPTPSWALFVAGAVMVYALWKSKKARSVTDTEVRLASGGSLQQTFTSSAPARAVVSFSGGAFKMVSLLLPASIRQTIDKRTDPTPYTSENDPPYDLLRASVNLVIASIIISIGTYMKLPLSTTYITFMVAIGASLADRKWQKGSAASRVTGMLTVVGGWLITGFLASATAFFMASILYLIPLQYSLLIVAAIISAWLIKSSASYNRMFAGKVTVMDTVDQT